MMNARHTFTFHCEHCGKQLACVTVASEEQLRERLRWSPLVCCDPERNCASNPHALRRVIRVTMEGALGA